ncbi:hypothetical protein AB0C34_27825 [Nocardia sp. NPDC049220]|uniref:hypothetical protein n=1 Tax=Nocardia sp. NPDC049220 TaxID=3155273 RepID=UPI0033C90C61
MPPNPNILRLSALMGEPFADTFARVREYNRANPTETFDQTARRLVSYAERVVQNAD